MEGGQLWRQYIIAIIANVIVICFGYIEGWTAPIGPKLRSQATSPLNYTPSVDEIAWLGSLLFVGSIFGPFVGGLAASKLGRKWGLISICIPMMIGWILVVMAVDMTFLYAARVLWGVGAGMMFSITTIYCAEIATDEARGALCSFIQVSLTLGCLLVYAIGPYISYYNIAYVAIAGVSAFAVIFFFMPETPTYYLLNNDREGAVSSLCMLRGRTRSGVQAELNKIEAGMKSSLNKQATFSFFLRVTEMFRGTNLKAFYISFALMLFQQSSGITAILFYLTDIFNDSGVHFEPAVSTVIVGAVQVIASFIAPALVDRLGRRLLLLVSSCGAAIGLILLGTFFLLEAHGSEVVAKIGFLPILSLVLFIVTYYSGLGPLPWTIASEIFSVEVKAIALPVITIIGSLEGFIVTRFFEPLAVALGRHTVFFMSAAFCIVSFFFTLFLVPETKGKSFQEIHDMLANRTSSKSEKT